MTEKQNHRPDVLAKVCGRAKYAADIKLPGMVHAVVVRSPLPSGRIMRVDSATARALPGVLAVKITTLPWLPAGLPSPVTT